MANPLVVSGDQELMDLLESLKTEGKKGKKIFRKGLRAGSKIVAARVKASFPRKSGVAAASTKIKAMKRKKGRMGLLVFLMARTARGFPYPVAQEYGSKPKPAGIRGYNKTLAQKLLNYQSSLRAGKPALPGAEVSRTSKAGRRIYASVAYRIKPGRWVQKAFEASAPQALGAVMSMIRDEMESEAAKK